MNDKPSLALLNVERRLDASPEQVFDALTEPAKMNQWFFGIPEGRAEVEQDLRVGGKYVVRMYDADGAESKCDQAEEARFAPHGEYLEIDPPRKLVFTWISEGFVDDSTVTIELKQDGDGTLLTLQHELPADAVDPHTHGWNECLGHLQKFVGS